MNVIMRHKVIFLVIASVVIALSIGLILRSRVADSTTQQTHFMMDTIVEIRATGPRSEDAVDRAFAEIQLIEKLFSRFIPEGDVARINENAGNWVTVSIETIDLIEKGISYGEITQGTFDITIGGLLTLWGFGTEQYRVPTDQELAQVMETVDYRNIEINRNSRQVRIPAGSMLDLGGIAKGYAVDRARDVLRENRIDNGLINAGGDIVTLGKRPDGNPWRVGVQNPMDTTSILAIVPLSDSTVVTSGDYQRFFTENGLRFHHIIDPSTGFPAEGVISVTIVAASATVADVFSTAVFILGVDDGQKLIETLDDIEAIIVDAQGQVWVSSGLEGQIQLL